MAKYFKPENTSLEAAIAQKEARQQQQQVQEQEQNSPLVNELQKQLEELKQQNQALQTQFAEQKNLEQKKQQEEQAKLEAAEAAKLAGDADLRKLLSMPDSDKYDSLTNKDLIDLFTTSLETALDARQKQQNKVLENRLQDLTGEISKTQQAVMQVATTIDVKDVQKQYTDFDEYQKEAATIMQEIPNISVKDAYLLAKSRKASTTVNQQNVDRERPDTTVRRSPTDVTVQSEERLEQSRNRASERKVGVAGVRDIIDAGLDKILSQRGDVYGNR